MEKRTSEVGRPGFRLEPAATYFSGGGRAIRLASFCGKREEYTDGIEHNARVFIARNGNFRAVPHYVTQPGGPQALCKACHATLYELLSESDTQRHDRHQRDAQAFICEGREPDPADL